MNKVRHYCVNCRENGEEDDNVIFDMSGYWDIESQSWVPSDLPTIEEYCGTCGSESTETEEVPDHTPDPRDEPIGHDFHRELHEYRVQKGEIEE